MTFKSTGGNNIESWNRFQLNQSITLTFCDQLIPLRCYLIPFHSGGDNENEKKERAL